MTVYFMFIDAGTSTTALHDTTHQERQDSFDFNALERSQFILRHLITDKETIQSMGWHQRLGWHLPNVNKSI